MSTDSAQWPVVAPGFMYIVKMGDFTHILQPADQRSSEHLNLAQMAIRDINVARKLLNERGPFLLLDKQQKMDELISETEDAISRVIKILEPSRVEHISDQSIRFNTRDPWALRNEPKSAATFSRLHITHDALKTVVHDLNNIEATAQLDDCETRANPITDTAISHPVQPPVGDITASSSGPTGAAAAPGITRSLSKDARSLITWKRSRRNNRQARHDPALHNIQSNTSSISETTTDDRDLNDVLSPVSPDARFANSPAGNMSSRPRRESTSTPVSLSHSESVPDQVSDTSGLPVIHELEGGGGPSIVPLGPVRLATPVTNGDVKQPVPLVQPQKALNNVTPSQVHDVESGSHQKAPAKLAPALRITPPTLKEPSRPNKKTFEEHRKRGRESRRLSNSGLNDGQQMSLTEEHDRLLGDRQEVTQPVYQSDLPARFHSLKARSPAGRTNSGNVIQAGQKIADGGPYPVPNGQPTPLVSGSGAGRPLSIVSPIAQHQPRENQDFGHSIESSVWPPKPATYPPLQTQLRPPPRNITPGDGSPGPSNQILSPSRTQLSPQEQIRSPDTEDSVDQTQLQPHERNPQIFAIDPELTKMPSILKPGRGRQETRSRPISQASSRQRGELHFPENSLDDPVKAPLDRSTTAPPLLNAGTEASVAFLQFLPTRNELAHLRSMSETAVPQINVVRAPTVPRKPLTYCSSPSPARNVSPVNVSRIGTPISQQPQSEVTDPLSTMQQTAKTASGPPSPVHSDHPETLTAQRPCATSLHSLSVQASASSSTRSSISAEEPAARSVLLSDQPLTMPQNGLAMNPPEIPNRGRSAYQAQKLVQSDQPTQASMQILDYNSPAMRQAPHFDPDHIRHLGPASMPHTETTSRFRDQDQAKIVPISNHARSQTVPIVSSATQVQVPEARKSPPAIAQAHKLLPSQQPRLVDVQSHLKSSPSPQPTDHSKSSFLHHQAARLESRQRSGPNPQPVNPSTLQQIPQPTQPPPPPPSQPPRIVLTPMRLPDTSRAAPRVDINYTTGAVPKQSTDRSRIAAQQIQKQADTVIVKDQGLSDRQVLQPSPDKQPPNVAVAFIPAPASTTEDSLSETQNWSSHHAQATVPQHDCQCDDDSSQSKGKGKARQDSDGLPNALPQIVPVTDPPVAVHHGSMQPVPNQRKKKSWLAHHAGKYGAHPEN